MAVTFERGPARRVVPTGQGGRDRLCMRSQCCSHDGRRIWNYAGVSGVIIDGPGDAQEMAVLPQRFPRRSRRGAMGRFERLAKLEAKLLRRRDHLRAALQDDLETLTRMSPVGGDLADVALEIGYEDVISQLADSESRELRSIEEAISRLRSGTYGDCQGCGKPIPLARLEVIPDATLCVKCQRLVESSGCRDWSQYQQRAYDRAGRD
ncbi:MAG: TraR/DksA family transcriptional regulator [Planctomycetota bacterium]|nr:MAG: TraR/DksA family transcriptional regulator [Planctomycetota bacterium]